MSMAGIARLRGLRDPLRVHALDPLGVELGRAVDGSQAQQPGSRVDEPMRHVWWPDYNMTACDHKSLVTELEGGLAGFHQEHLGIRVPVQLWAGTRFGVDQDHR